MADKNVCFVLCHGAEGSNYAKIINRLLRTWDAHAFTGLAESQMKTGDQNHEDAFKSFSDVVNRHDYKGNKVRLIVESNYGEVGKPVYAERAQEIVQNAKYPVLLFSGSAASFDDDSIFFFKKDNPETKSRVWYATKNYLNKNRLEEFLEFDFEGSQRRDIEYNRDFEESRDISAGTDQVRNIVNVYAQIATNPDLQKLRQQERGLFDTLLKHAVPFALNAAQTAVSLIGGNRDLGATDIAVQRHLPTALNLAHQIQTLPEVQYERGLFDKLFSIGMPLVLNTAQTLFGAKRGLGAADDDAQRGFFDSIIGNLPGTVFNVLSSVIGKRDLGDESRDIGEGDRGFFDILKKFAPIVLNVAGSAVQSLQGQRSLAFAPTDRGFWDKIKNFAKKVINNPIVKQIGGMVLKTGMGMVQNLISGKRAIREPIPSTEAAESQVRGFFGSMLQSLAPIAMGALQGAVNSIGKRDIEGGRDLVVPQERGLFDIVAQYLPTVIQVAQQNFANKRALGGVTEDESQYLNRVVNTVTVPLIAAAQHHIANPSAEGKRGILGSILGGLLPF